MPHPYSGQTYEQCILLGREAGLGQVLVLSLKEKSYRKETKVKLHVIGLPVSSLSQLYWEYTARIVITKNLTDSPSTHAVGERGKGYKCYNPGRNQELRQIWREEHTH